MLVNSLFCKEEWIIDGTIFFDTCSMTVRFFGMLKGEKQKENEIRKWNDHLTDFLGVEIKREFRIKYSKNRIDDAVSFIAHKSIMSCQNIEHYNYQLIQLYLKFCSNKIFVNYHNFLFRDLIPLYQDIVLQF